MLETKNSKQTKTVKVPLLNSKTNNFIIIIYFTKLFSGFLG